MKLITELNEEIQILQEENNGKKRLYIEGIIMQHSIKNRNGRVYPREILVNEVNRYVREKVNTNSAYGELGHPSTPTINADRISHRFTELKEDGNNIVGKALVASTSMGDVVRGLIEDGGRLGISSRGLGSLKESNGVMVVQKDFFLNTAGDIVIDPSAPDAYINGILEGREWVWNNGLLVEHVVAGHKKVIERATSVNLEEKVKAVMEDFIKQLGKH